MKIIDLQNELNALQLLIAGERTSTVTGSGVDIQGYQGKLKVILDSDQASAGTTPTLDVKIQDSPNNSDWTDVTGATFTQITDAAGGPIEAIGLDTRGVDRYIRAIGTIGGTSTPTFDFCVVLVGQKQIM